MILLWLTVTAAVGVLFAATRGRLTAVFATVVVQLFFLSGLARQAADGAARSSTVDRLAIALVTFCLGYACIRRFAPARRTDAETPRTIDPIHLIPPLGLMLALTVYHFAVVGIPILSENVELDRWRFTESGLFGLPGRAYLLGLPVMAVLSYQVRRTRPDDRLATAVMVTAVTATLLTRVIGGFRGEVLDLVVLLFIVQASATGGRTVRAATRTYGTLAIVALFFALAVSSLYTTSRGGTTPDRDDVAAGLVDRATTIASRPTVLVMEARDESLFLMAGDTIANDFRVYLSRYVSGEPADGFDFKTVVSATMNGRSLDQSRQKEARTFVVPVTIGFFPVLFYNYGPFTFALTALLGALFALVERAVRAPNPLRSLWATTALIVLHQSIHKGDIAFQSLNWAAMAALVSASVWFSDALVERTPTARLAGSPS